MRIRPFRPDDEAAAVALWEHCGLVRAWNDPHKDIRRLGYSVDEVSSMGKRLEHDDGTG